MRTALLTLLLVAIPTLAKDRKWMDGTVSSIEKQPHSSYGNGNKAVLYKLQTEAKVFTAADPSTSIFNGYREELWPKGAAIRFAVEKDKIFVIVNGKEKKLWLDAESTR